MALPTAQLGAMSSINVPSYLPTQVIQKQPKLWQQALAQLLTQAAGQVVGQGVQNVMSRDYAPEFGQEKAGLVEKLMSGPRANEKTFQMKAQTARDVGMEELRQLGDRTNREFTAQQNALSNADERAGRLELAGLKQRGENSQMKMQAGEHRANRELQALLAQINQTADEARALEAGNRDIVRSNEERMRTEPRLRAQTTRDMAETQKTLEEIKGMRQMQKLMEQRGGQGQQQVNPNIIKDRTAAPVDPRMQRVFEALGANNPSAPIDELALRQALGSGANPTEALMRYLASLPQ